MNPQPAVLETAALPVELLPFTAHILAHLNADVNAAGEIAKPTHEIVDKLKKTPKLHIFPYYSKPSCS